MFSRILLADDSAHAQRMGERILREEGYEVVSVIDGESAVKQLAEIDPDVIVVDVFLPKVDGLELCQRIKSTPQHRHVRVVMTAGMLEAFDEEAAMRAGADGIIKKPFEASVVIATLKPLIAAAQADRENGPAVEAAITPEVVPPPPAAEPVVIVAPQAPPVPAAVEPPHYEVVVVMPDDDPPQPPVPAPPVVEKAKEPPRPLGSSFPAFAKPVSTPAFTPQRVVAPVIPPAPVAPPPVAVAPPPPPAPVPAAIAAKPADIDPELVRAAVTIALDEAMPALVDDITERVLSALRKIQ